MIEAPEALFLSGQLNRNIQGKLVTDVIVAFTPHKFTFFSGTPDEYAELLLDQTVCEAMACGGMVDINLTHNRHIVFTDGANLRLYAPGEKLPNKHQLLIGFADQSCLVATTRMYAIMCCFEEGAFTHSIASYYEAAITKPQVMSDAFTREYFMELINDDKMKNKSAKAFLATEQTIPGLGNGVLQDILYNARIHPKIKINLLADMQKNKMYDCVKSTLQKMYLSDGRNSETDLYGTNGKYISYLSKDTVGKFCPRCGEVIRKENYMGGSIYYCSECQPESNLFRK